MGLILQDNSKEYVEIGRQYEREVIGAKSKSEDLIVDDFLMVFAFLIFVSSVSYVAFSMGANWRENKLSQKK